MSVKQQILDVLEYCKLDDFLTEDNVENLIFDYLPEKFLNSFNYDNGATKLVLIPQGADYVIKIPFDGSCSSYTSYSYSSKRNSFGYYDRHYTGHMTYDESQPFKGAIYGGGWDYCYVEAVIYKKAEKAHIEKAFAKTQFIGEVAGHPIYMQQRVDPFYRHIIDKDESSSDTSSTAYICKKHNYSRFNLVWQTDVINYYGEAFFHRLMNFIKEEEINDLHRGNLGYLNGRPVLLDYSGFRG